MRVLFVCTGNICRSPTAHGVFASRVEKAGLADKIETDSAGTQAYHQGEAPDVRAIKTAKARGVDLSPLRARKVVAHDFENFDYILAMDRGHFDILSKQASTQAQARIHMFLPKDVPDPWYGDERGFESVYDMIEDGCEKWLSRIRGEL